MQQSLFDMGPRVLTVSAINAYIRQKLEADATLNDVWLEGEISNWSRASSGHIYFTLKDSKASLRCVIWRSQANRLVYLPGGNGEAVLAHGRISVYEAGGNYQFYVDDLEPAGQGDLNAQFERLKAKLDAEGLFDEGLKRPIPPVPRRIGIVTSPTTAALRDVLNVLRRRYPLAEVLLSPTPVQGDDAPRQIVAALEAIAQQPVDVIILTRGGGSLEDLWAFNDERVARAVAACPIPIVSGVGHEIDFTIADFVADERAPTPSAAAELVTPDRVEIKRTLLETQLGLTSLIQKMVDQRWFALERQQLLLDHHTPQTRINNDRQRIDGLTTRLGQALRHSRALEQARVQSLVDRLAALNPEATLARGYAIVQKANQVVTSTGEVASGDEITVRVEDGEFGAKVE